MNVRKRMLSRAKKMGWELIILEEHDYTDRSIARINQLLDDFYKLETEEEKRALREKLVGNELYHHL